MIIIAAIADNNVIGNKGEIPWHISEDFKQFKAHTKDQVILMGLNTFRSLGNKPLPDRVNIVLTNEPIDRDDIVEVHSIEEGIDKAKSYGKEIFICGGGMVYKSFMPLADKLYISHVKGEYEGDTFFPEIEKDKWIAVGKKEYDEFTFVEYERIK